MLQHSKSPKCDDETLANSSKQNTQQKGTKQRPWKSWELDV
jgi:hypothetical protein